MKVKEIIELIHEDYKDKDDIEIKSIFHFSNGNTAVLDTNGKQIAFLQYLLSNPNIEMITQ